MPELTKERADAGMSTKAPAGIGVAGDIMGDGSVAGDGNAIRASEGGASGDAGVDEAARSVGEAAAGVGGDAMASTTRRGRLRSGTGKQTADKQNFAASV